MKKLFSALALTVILLSCSKVPSGTDEQGKDKPSAKGSPISVVDGKVRFFIDYSEPSSLRKTLGLPTTDFTGYKVNVNGSDYTLYTDDAGNWYADVEAMSNNVYNAVLITRNSSKWFGSSAYKDVAVPHSQFWSGTKSSFKDYPRYASYNEASGNVLDFHDAVSMLDIHVKGSGKISSVKVLSLGGNIIAGKAMYSPTKEAFQMTEGVDFAVVNCTENGSFVSMGQEGVSVPVLLAPASLSKGLEITVCGADHKMARKTITPDALTQGKVLSVDFDYAPDSDLVWYEGFDNFVWGGNIMGGEKTKGYSPDAAKIGILDGGQRNGYADAFAAVSCDTPGSGFIQSNTWADVSGKWVGTSHVMSDSYIASRNLSDWRYLFRCQEYQGVLAVGSGEGNKSRGVMQTAAITNIKGLADITVEFKFCFENGAGDDLLFELVNAGYINSVMIDGKDIGTQATYSGSSSLATIDRTKLSIPATALEAKTWHTATVTASNATDGTYLYFAGADPNAATVHGFYLDDLTVRHTADNVRKGNLRILYWNIQNGMWSDQANNYVNFVAFVKKYDPDICVWCEASSIYKDNTNSSQTTSLRFLPSGWPALAARYGHNYTAIGGFRDNYPQVITSKYPITTLLKITDTDVAGKPIAHGAAIQQVNVNGRGLHFVTCHMWPQAYGYGVATSKREESAAAHEGDYYRQFEMEYIVSHSINSPEYSGVTDWILLGDLNSRSRLDNWYMGYPENDTRLLTQDVVLNKTNLHDAIYECYPAPKNLVSTTGGTARIDFVYLSSPLMSKVVNALVIGDKWMTQSPSIYVPSFYDPSDHRPIMIDLEL
ncbi:MAG: metal-dependent hydrolase [Bacteroidales bacterium]|nr:metal-dependent hydrolase [Bacteroidales bacterium]